MRTFSLPLLLLALLLNARENPFTPVEITESPSAVKTVPEKEQNSLQSEPESVIESVSDEKEVFNFAKARFVFSEKSVYIETKDTIVRHFAIANPPSIVIDFSSSSDFASKRKELNVRPFVKLEMGAHKDYYRVVLRLDEVHTYTIEKRRFGQVVTITD